MDWKSAKMNLKSGPIQFFLLVVVLISSTGCVPHLGSKTIPRDRFDYSGAITTSWKEQMLLNLVKMRYADPPVFVNVQQIVSQYTFERDATINSPHWDGTSGDPAGVAAGKWTESPTITYDPMTGEKYIKSLIRPVAPASLLGLVEAGWPIDTIFAVGVRSINGVQAPTNVFSLKLSGSADFYRVLTLMRELQDSGAVALRLSPEESKNKSSDDDSEDEKAPDDSKDADSKKHDSAEDQVIMILRTEPLSDEGKKASLELRKLLHLSPDAMQFSLVFAGNATNDHEVAMITRSMLEILAQTAYGVDVPASDISEGRATPFPQGVVNQKSFFDLKVHASDHRPSSKDAFATVRYRSLYFYVDDRDLQSKRSLGFLMALFTLLESGTSAAPPVFTISRP